MGKSLLGYRYNPDLDYIMVTVKERNYTFVKYIYINKITKEYVLFFINIIKDFGKGEKSTPIYLNKKRKVISLIEIPNMSSIDYQETALRVLDIDTVKYIDNRDNKIDNVYSLCPLVIKNNTFAMDPISVRGKKDVFITPTVPPQQEIVSKFITYTAMGIQNEMKSIFDEYKSITEIDSLRISEPFSVDNNDLTDLRGLVEIQTLLKIIPNPDRLLDDISNLVQINVHYKYFIQGDLIKIHLNNNVSLDINLYFCNYFDCFLYYIDNIEKE